MRLRVCTCVYPPAFASEQVLSDTGLMDRWSSLSWQSVQVRTCGVSCPKVHEGGGVYHPQCQRAAEYLRSQEVRGMMGGDERKEGGVTRERERGGGEKDRERRREREW